VLDNVEKRFEPDIHIHTSSGRHIYVGEEVKIRCYFSKQGCKKFTCSTPHFINSQSSPYGDGSRVTSAPCYNGLTFSR